jgi:hypothetical protein
MQMLSPSFKLRLSFLKKLFNRSKTKIFVPNIFRSFGYNVRHQFCYKHIIFSCSVIHQNYKIFIQLGVYLEIESYQLTHIWVVKNNKMSHF